MEQVRLSNDPQTLLRYAESLHDGSKIALEAIGNVSRFPSARKLCSYARLVKNLVFGHRI